MTAPQMIHSDTGSDPERVRSETRRLLALGALLIVVGLAAMAARTADLDLGGLIGEQTWPLLVVVPGLLLLGLAFVRTPPDGVGFAIAGSIVTTVGAILLVQANTANWASWAYVWALIPGAAGLGMAAYGLLTHTGELVDKGVWMVVIAGVLYIVGWWYFEGLFATGEQPVDVATWWPVALIAAGAVVAIRALFAAHGAAPPTASDTEGESTP
jgi:FtsH-binding integral membrane protein